MKINQILQAEVAEEQTGGGVQVLPTKQAPARSSRGRQAPPSSDDSDDDTVTDADREIFQKYNKLKSDGTPKNNSTLFGALTKADIKETDIDDEDEDEEGEEEPKQEKKPKEKKVDVIPDEKEKKDPEPDSDDELLKLDAAKIQTMRGAPLSPKAAEAFDKLKKGLQTKNTELEALRKEVETLKTQLTEKGDVDPEITKKYNDLKSEYDTEYFEKTDAFKEAYEKPIEDIKGEINGYFDIDPADTDTIKEVTSLFKQAADLAASGKKMAFAKVLNEIAENHVDGGQVIKNMFSQDMLKWYDAINEYTKIYKVKDEQRKQIISDKLKSRRNEGAGKIIGTIEEGVTSFKRNKKAVIDNLPDKLRDEYIKEIDDYATSIKDSVADFQLTGALTPAITEVLQRGITSKAIERELGIAWNAFGDLKNKNKILSDENTTLKEKIAKLTGEPRRDSTFTRKPQTKPVERQQFAGRGVSRIAEKLRETGGYDDED